ncbi:MAG: phosphodiester glycosidase family protein [Oscillospiraceae bacterium]|jgi:hypothetical protein|nr:phosphodiester glycosidase family protein [Oscillospiraceae bacterium]
MKKRITAVLSALLAVSLLFSLVPASAAGAGGARYINTKNLAENLRYVNTVYWDDELGREESYVLRCAPGGEAYPIVVKDETIYGRVDIAYSEAYARAGGRTVLAALNADFFSMQTGVPLGILIEDGIYKSSPEEEAALAFRADGSVLLSESPGVELTLTNPSGEAVTLTHLNKFRNDSGGMYLFTSDFSSVSTRSTTPGWFVRFEILSGAMTVSGEMTLRVVEAARSEGETPIGDGYILLTRGGEPNDDFYKFEVGDVVSLTSTCSDENLTQARWATGCGNLLVKDGAIGDYGSWDRVLSQRNPRTAIGVTATGEIVACVIDGRSSTYSSGVTLVELAEEMIAQGCVTAVNLDGGGSSVMSVKTPGMSSTAVVNRPSDGSPRRCSTYIMFAAQGGAYMPPEYEPETELNQEPDSDSDPLPEPDDISAPSGENTIILPGGAPRRLALANDGAIILAGSSVKLAYVAEDSAWLPTAAPEDIEASSGAQGNISGGIYTAGAAQGADALTLHSPSTGAHGTGEMFVLTAPTSLTAYDTFGNALTEVTLAPGDELALDPVATYYRKAVISQPVSYTYEVTGGIGEVSPDGVFTAAAKSGLSGEIKITIGEREAIVKVNTLGFEDIVGHWAREYISELRGLNIVNGVTETEFMPGDVIRRSDFVLMIHRALGSPEAPPPEIASPEITPPEVSTPEITPSEPDDTTDADAEPETDIDSEIDSDTTADTEADSDTNTEVPTDADTDTTTEPEPSLYADFEDVPPDAYYAAAVLWAKRTGVVNGIDDRHFDPEGSLTREQAFTLVYRVFDMLKITMPEGYSPQLDGFDDVADVSNYALDATAALVAAGIVSGGGDGRLSPKNSVTRAEMSKLLCAALRLKGTEIIPITKAPTEEGAAAAESAPPDAENDSPDKDSADADIDVNADADVNSDSDADNSDMYPEA